MDDKKLNLYKIFFTGALFLTLVSVSQNASAWSKKDTYWEASYFSAHLIDWGQSLDIAKRCNNSGYVENNPIIGRCPAVKSVNVYFVTTALLHYGVAYILPKKYRNIFQAGTFLMELTSVASNASIGLNVNF